jgi:hypothetical protein
MSEKRHINNNINKFKHYIVECKLSDFDINGSEYFWAFFLFFEKIFLSWNCVFMRRSRDWIKKIKILFLFVLTNKNDGSIIISKKDR